MWTTPSVVSILARWLPSRTSSMISGWRPSASPTCWAWSGVGRDEVDPDGRARAAGPARAASPAPPCLRLVELVALAARRPGWSPAGRRGRSRPGAGRARRAGCRALVRGRGRVRWGRGHRRRVLRRRSCRSRRSRPMRRPAYAPALLRGPPSARAGGMATAVTPAATTNRPTMIEAASRDAHSSSAPTTNGSRNGRSRRDSGMNSCRRRASRRPRRRAGRWSSSRTRSGSPARPPCRASAPR